MTVPSPSLASQAAALRATAEAARAPVWLPDALHAQIMACLARIFARLSDMLALWEAGLLPPPTIRAPAPRTPSQAPATRNPAATRPTRESRAQPTHAQPTHAQPTHAQPTHAQPTHAQVVSTIANGAGRITPIRHRHAPSRAMPPRHQPRRSAGINPSPRPPRPARAPPAPRQSGFSTPRAGLPSHAHNVTMT